MHAVAKTPAPPYFAVIFSSIRTDGDNGYAEVAKRMFELASRQSGFLGFETARQGIGIFISFWASLEAIQLWKENVEHREAQKNAKAWYSSFHVRVCRVEKEYGF